MLNQQFRYNIDDEEARAKLYSLRQKEAEQNKTEAEKDQQKLSLLSASSDYLSELLDGTEETDPVLKQMKQAERVNKRYANKVGRLNRRLDRAMENGNENRAARLQKKLDKASGKYSSDMADIESGTYGSGIDYGAGAATAISQAPAIISNLSQKPTGNAERNMGIAQSTAQFASIGLAAGGWIGAGVGALVGAGVGFFSQQGWQNDLRKQADRETIAALEADKLERTRMFIQNSNAEQTKAQADMYASVLGQSNKSFNS